MEAREWLPDALVRFAGRSARKFHSFRCEYAVKPLLFHKQRLAQQTLTLRQNRDRSCRFLHLPDAFRTLAFPGWHPASIRNVVAINDLLTRSVDHNICATSG